MSYIMCPGGIHILKDTLERIIYPEIFNNERICQHYKLTEDLESILEKSGYINHFKRKYRQRLRFLIDRGQLCIERYEWFESLKNEPDLYSMKIKGELNIRIIFTFCSKNPCKIIILLCGFNEKKTKDYDSALNTAKKRLSEILGK